MTGEGFLGQFALFDYVATGVFESSVFGYSPQLDKVVQYPVEVIEGKFRPIQQFWVWQVFSTKPVRPGYWNFTWEAAHGSDGWIHEDVRFDPARQVFIEKKTIKPYPGMAKAYCDLELNELPELLASVGKIAPAFDISTIQGIRSLIDTTHAGEFSGTDEVISFKGKVEDVQLKWLKSGTGKVGIRFLTGWRLAEAIRTNLPRWCGTE